jgi:hypothetical protein
LNFNREAAHLPEIQRNILQLSQLQIYFLVCYYGPSIIGGSRNPECVFNALKASNYFVFLLVGLILAAYVVNMIAYFVSTARMTGQNLQNFLIKNYMVTVSIHFVIALFGFGSWGISV